MGQMRRQKRLKWKRRRISGDWRDASLLYSTIKITMKRRNLIITKSKWKRVSHQPLARKALPRLKIIASETSRLVKSNRRAFVIKRASILTKLMHWPHPLDDDRKIRKGRVCAKHPNRWTSWDRSSDRISSKCHLGKTDWNWQKVWTWKRIRSTSGSGRFSTSMMKRLGQSKCHRVASANYLTKRSSKSL